MSDSTRKPKSSQASQSNKESQQQSEQDPNQDILTIRTDYSDETFDVDSAPKDPIILFQTLWRRALDVPVHTPNACTLATTSKSGKPSARIILLREYDSAGFTFYTNYNSRKSQELEANPFASMLFFWAELEIQIRVEGTIERVESEVSDAYFSTRPRDSQLGAWASPQSEPIKDRSELDQKVLAVSDKMSARLSEGESIPRPPFWGGYRLIPTAIEFWKGRPNRLHDRILYKASSSATQDCQSDATNWTISRLAP